MAAACSAHKLRSEASSEAVADGAGAQWEIGEGAMTLDEAALENKEEEGGRVEPGVH